MLDVLNSGFSFYNNVVNVDFHGSGLEDFRQSLISSTSILKPKRHNLVAVQPMWCNKGCLFLIRMEHRDLVVSGESIKKGKHPMSGGSIDYLIYLG